MFLLFIWNDGENLLLYIFAAKATIYAVFVDLSEVEVNIETFSPMSSCQPFQTLISKFHRITNWWNNKSPTQKWDSITKIAIVPGHLIGVHLFCDLKINWYSASCAVMIGMFFSLNFYTIQYYLRQGAVVRGMECTYLVGVVVGVREVLRFVHFESEKRTNIFYFLWFLTSFCRTCLFIGKQLDHIVSNSMQSQNFVAIISITLKLKHRGMKIYVSSTSKNCWKLWLLYCFWCLLHTESFFWYQFMKAIINTIASLRSR